MDTEKIENVVSVQSQETEYVDTNYICRSDSQECPCPEYAIIFACALVNGEPDCLASLGTFQLAMVYKDADGNRHIGSKGGPLDGTTVGSSVYHIYKVYPAEQCRQAEDDCRNLTDEKKIKTLKESCNFSYHCCAYWNAIWNRSTKSWTVNAQPQVGCYKFSGNPGKFMAGPGEGKSVGKWLANCHKIEISGVATYSAVYVQDNGICTSCDEGCGYSHPGTPPACECYNHTLGSKVVNSTTAPVWNLAPFQGQGVGIPGARWRLIEVGAPLIHASGEVDYYGRLTGLPSSFSNSEIYDGYMELQIYCV